MLMHGWVAEDMPDIRIKVDLARVDICSEWDVLIACLRDGLRQLIRDDQNMRILDFSDW